MNLMSKNASYGLNINQSRILSGQPEIKINIAGPGEFIA